MTLQDGDDLGRARSGALAPALLEPDPGTPGRGRRACPLQGLQVDVGEIERDGAGKRVTACPGRIERQDGAACLSDDQRRLGIGTRAVLGVDVRLELVDDEVQVVVPERIQHASGR